MGCPAVPRFPRRGRDGRWTPTPGHVPGGPRRPLVRTPPRASHAPMGGVSKCARGCSIPRPHPDAARASPAGGGPGGRTGAPHGVGVPGRGGGVCVGGGWPGAAEPRPLRFKSAGGISAAAKTNVTYFLPVPARSGGARGPGTAPGTAPRPPPARPGGPPHPHAPLCRRGSTAVHGGCLQAGPPRSCWGAAGVAGWVLGTHGDVESGGGVVCLPGSCFGFPITGVCSGGGGRGCPRCCPRPGPTVPCLCRRRARRGRIAQAPPTAPPGAPYPVSLPPPRGRGGHACGECIGAQPGPLAQRLGGPPPRLPPPLGGGPPSPVTLACACPSPPARTALHTHARSCTPTRARSRAPGHAHTPCTVSRSLAPPCTLLHTRARRRAPRTLSPSPACRCTHPAGPGSLHVFLHVPRALAQPCALCAPSHAPHGLAHPSRSQPSSARSCTLSHAPRVPAALARSHPAPRCGASSRGGRPGLQPSAPPHRGSGFSHGFVSAGSGQGCCVELSTEAGAMGRAS